MADLQMPSFGKPLVKVAIAAEDLKRTSTKEFLVTGKQVDINIIVASFITMEIVVEESLIQVMIENTSVIVVDFYLLEVGINTF